MHSLRCRHTEHQVLFSILFKLLILKFLPHAQINVSSYRLTQKNLLKVSKELDQDQAKLLGWNELLATISKLGGEVEAVSRSAQQSNRDFKAVNYQLNSFSP